MEITITATHPSEITTANFGMCPSHLFSVCAHICDLPFVVRTSVFLLFSIKSRRYSLVRAPVGFSVPR